MQARAPLMIEHRLIEQMIHAIRKAIHHADQTNTIDPHFIDKAVDFLRVYADRTHHGKEEEILFRKLREKHLSGEDRVQMEDLIQDHTLSRNNTKRLVAANIRYRQGDSKALDEVMNCLKFMVDFYPIHIRKEDAVFFPASRSYFSEEEDQAMLAEFWEFDRKMIHEKYKSMVTEFEAG